MENAIKKNYIYIRWFLIRLGLVVYDVFAVNFAYFLALLVRYYVNLEFNAWALNYLTAFIEFAPYYTIVSLVVFWFLGLYKSLWKYAGIRDMNRIIASSVITGMIHVLATLLFVRRMPITYYVLGAVFQLALISLGRFSYRLLMMERGSFQNRRKNGKVNVMIIGLGEASRAVIKHIGRNKDSVARPVCLVDVDCNEVAGTIDGIPVIAGAEKIEEAAHRYQVERILLADSIVPSQIKDEVKAICQKLELPMQTFSGYFESAPCRIPLITLLEYVEGPLLLEVGDKQEKYDSSTQAAESAYGKYIVSALRMSSGVLCIHVIQDVLCPNDVQEDWVKNYEKETGETISFF